MALFMQCRVCHSKHLEPVIDLGEQPWANHFLREHEVGMEPRYPLRVVFCLNCATSQLDFTVAKETMFGDHTYLSGMTQSLEDHFRRIANEVDNRFFRHTREKSVLDIGSNDGTQLKNYKELGYDVFGVESSVAIAKMANQNGIPTANEFFNSSFVSRLKRQFDIINASGVFFHLEELHSVTEGIKRALKKGGVFVVQFMYMKKIIENCAFDQIYHEHLLYYTLRALQRLLSQYDLEMFDAELAPIHGGSIIAFVTHKGRLPINLRLWELFRIEDKSGVNHVSAYQKFAQNILEKKRKNLEFLNAARKSGKIIYGMGAPVKGNTLLNYFEIGPETIQYLVEKNPLRKGLFAPGSHIPLLLEHEVRRQPDIYYVLAWNFRREILKRHEHLLEQGVEFYFPVEEEGGA